MSTLFISHGSPTLAIEPGATGALLHALAQSLPRPKAILMVSAHWDTRIATLSLAEQPETIHDFGGFPKAMYEIQYPAKGAPSVAKKTAALLEKSGIAVQFAPTRGLDHGAWVPLMLMYPEADIPVTQLSVQSQAVQSQPSSAAHYQLGQAIRPLQEDNIMIIASGAITHNLHDFFTAQRDARVLDYVPAFTHWVADKIEQNDMDALIHYRTKAPSGIRAHPSEDHLMPLFVALGAGAGKPVRYQPENTFGILAMDIYAWQ